MKKLSLIFVCLFMLGAGVRAIDVWHPVDRPSWRECDVAGIARNYYREGMSLFYPRIDWRGDGPGYVESEFPLFPWLIAAGYKIFGYNEHLGRILSYIFSLLTLAAFIKFARHLLPPVGAVAAVIFFAFNPLIINISTTLQAEGLMFLSYTLAAYFFLRWVENNSTQYFVAACVATALTILAKVPAAHIGLLFAVLVLTKFGFSALRQFRLYLFALCALLPAILWYVFAHQFWTVYGNSLGLSSEYHWAGWDLFTNPKFIIGITRSEVFYVFMPAGIIIAALGLWLRRTEQSVRYSVYWLVSIWLYYLVSARTLGDQWAAYYHVVSVPPVAILVGNGVEAIRQIKASAQWTKRLAIMSGLLAALLGAGAGILWQKSNALWMLGAAAVFAVTTLMLLTSFVVRERSENSFSRASLFQALIIYAGIVSFCGIVLFQARQIIVDLNNPKGAELLACAKSFIPLLPKDELVLTTGGDCRDEDGYRLAYNASFMLFWTDHKGFNICTEEESLESVATFARRGAKYYLVAKGALRAKEKFAADLRHSYPLVADCGEYCLFKLKPNEIRD